MNMITAILNVIGKALGLVNKTPDREVKRRQAAKSDVAVIEYDIKEVKANRRLVKAARKAQQKADGTWVPRWKVWKKRKSLIEKGEDIMKAAKEIKDKLNKNK